LTASMMDVSSLDSGAIRHVGNQVNRTLTELFR
jgi:hypothetical protein